MSCLLRNSDAPSALKHIVHKLSSLYAFFHSVIYNSVGVSYEEQYSPHCTLNLNICILQHCSIEFTDKKVKGLREISKAFIMKSLLI